MQFENRLSQNQCNRDSQNPDLQPIGWRVTQHEDTTSTNQNTETGIDRSFAHIETMNDNTIKIVGRFKKEEFNARIYDILSWIKDQMGIVPFNQRFMPDIINNNREEINYQGLLEEFMIKNGYEYVDVEIHVRRINQAVSTEYVDNEFHQTGYDQWSYKTAFAIQRTEYTYVGVNIRITGCHDGPKFLTPNPQNVGNHEQMDC